jgi:hypothetical protein
MTTSGLIVRLEPAAALDALSAVPGFTFGERHGDLIALVLEANGPGASEERFEWLRRQPGVSDIEVVFVHWGGCEMEVTNAGI